MFFKMGVLKNFAIFRGKHLRWSLFLIKLQVYNFPVNIPKFLRKAFLMKHLRWLILKNSSVSPENIGGGVIIFFF